MANCPLRDADDIASSLVRFEQSGAPAQISCFRYGFMNPWWASRLDEAGHATPIFLEAMTQRSQDLPPLYCPTGAIWLATGDALKTHGSFYAPGHIFHPISWLSAMDIDDADDLEMARAFYGFALQQAGK